MQESLFNSECLTISHENFIFIDEVDSSVCCMTRRGSRSLKGIPAITKLRQVRSRNFSVNAAMNIDQMIGYQYS